MWHLLLISKYQTDIKHKTIFLRTTDLWMWPFFMSMVSMMHLFISTSRWWMAPKSTTLMIGWTRRPTMTALVSTFCTCSLIMQSWTITTFITETIDILSILEHWLTTILLVLYNEQNTNIGILWLQRSINKD